MVQEHIYCPECGKTVNAESPEFLGEGEMVRQVGCSKCDWFAVEEWELTNVDVDEM